MMPDWVARELGVGHITKAAPNVRDIRPHITPNDEDLTDEIAWLRSFGWTDEQIALRLDIKVTRIRKRNERDRRREAA